MYDEIKAQLQWAQLKWAQPNCTLSIIWFKLTKIFRNSHYLKVQFEADSDDETIPRPIRFIFSDFMSQNSKFSVRNR